MIRKSVLSRYLPLFIIVCLSSWLAGCGGPQAQIAFADPPNGATLTYSGSPLLVRLTGSNLPFTGSNPGPAYANLTDNGQDLYNEEANTLYEGLHSTSGGGFVLPFDAPEFSGNGIFLRLYFYPTTYGEHTLTATACINSGNCTSAPSIRVCIVPDPNNPAPVSTNGFSVPVGSIPVGNLGSCVIPPTITPTPSVIIDSLSAYPSPIYYGQTCPSLSTLTFRAAITLPAGTTADQFQVAAHVGVVIGSTANRSGALLVPMPSTGTWDSSSGGQVYSGTLNLTHSYSDPNNQLDLAALGGNSGAILWSLTVNGDNGSGQNTELVHSLNQVVSLSPCPTAGHTPPHGSGSGSPSGCAQYTNETSCNLGGCAWNPQNSTCSVNQ